MIESKRAAMLKTEPGATHGGRRESCVVLLEKLKYQVGQMVMNLDPLIEVVEVEPQRIGKVLFQGEQVDRL